MNEKENIKSKASNNEKYQPKEIDNNIKIVHNMRLIQTEGQDLEV